MAGFQVLGLTATRTSLMFIASEPALAPEDGFWLLVPANYHADIAAVVRVGFPFNKFAVAGVAADASSYEPTEGEMTMLRRDDPGLRRAPISEYQRRHYDGCREVSRNVYLVSFS